MVLEANYYAGNPWEDTRVWILLIVLVPLGGSVILVLFTPVGVLGIGIHVALTVASQLTLVDFAPWVEKLFPKDLVILCLGFLGGIFLLAVRAYRRYSLSLLDDFGKAFTASVRDSGLWDKFPASGAQLLHRGRGRGLVDRCDVASLL